MLACLIVFLFLSFTTAKWQADSDGTDEVGFPLTFYTKFLGECMTCPTNPISIDYLNMTIDILISIFIGFSLFVYFESLLSRLKTHMKK